MSDEPRPFLGDFAAAIRPLNYVSRQLENSCVVKTGDGILYGLTVTNTKASAQFVLMFEGRTLPADTTVPIIAKSVPANDAVGFNWFPGRAFSSGLILCNSSTNATKTIGSADCLFDVQYA